MRRARGGAPAPARAAAAFGGKAQPYLCAAELGASCTRSSSSRGVEAKNWGFTGCSLAEPSSSGVSVQSLWFRYGDVLGAVRGDLPEVQAVSVLPRGTWKTQLLSARW